MAFTELSFNILAFVLGFLIVVLTIPPILNVAKAKSLFDTPGGRKIHTHEIPPLGGVAIFIGFSFSTVFALGDQSFASLRYYFIAVFLMLAIGLKDDLIGISAIKKFTIQFLAALLLVTLGNVNITNLHGLFGVYEINYFAGALLSLFTILSIVNAFNLIDGIDGLASGLSILASFSFGIWFFLAGFTQYSIVSFALTGSLSAFFLFNVFGKANKLFMGDTGSLFVGLVIAIYKIKFCEYNLISNIPNALDSAPVISFAIVMVPLIDVMRVMAIRVFAGKSPFAADKRTTSTTNYSYWCPIICW